MTNKTILFFVIMILGLLLTGCIPQPIINSTAHSEITLEDRNNMTGQSVIVYNENYTDTGYFTIQYKWVNETLITDVSSDDTISLIDFEFFYPLIPGGVYPSKVTLRLYPNGSLNRIQELNCLGCLTIINHTESFTKRNGTGLI